MTLVDRAQLREALLWAEPSIITEAARSVLEGDEIYYCSQHERSQILPFGACAAMSRDCQTSLRVMLEVVEEVT